MSSPNPLNIYTGPSSIRDYHNPSKAPLLPLVELPPHLNPHYADGVRIYAKMMNALPAHNVKALPALNLLTQERTPATETIVEYSSGSTIISMAVLSRVLYGITDTWAYVSNKTHMTKLRLLQFFGLKVRLFGGPSTPDPDDIRGGIYAAEKARSNDGKVLNPNQYANDANWRAHCLWTGPQVMEQLPEIGIFCAAMGTTGTLSGVGTYLKEKKPSVRCLGVCIAPQNEVPGPRMLSMIQKINFPWRETVDALEEVNTLHSYSTSIALCREGIICGPSSGLGYRGLLRYLNNQISAGSLDDLRDPNGHVHCVFMCCDLPYLYLDEYSHILGSEYFAPIVNENLLGVDKYTYDSRWELDAQECLERMDIDIRDLVQQPSATSRVENNTSSTYRHGKAIIDFRSPAHFQASHIRNSLNIPLESVTSSNPSPFADADVLECQWKELDECFRGMESKVHGLSRLMEGEEVLLICYTGDTARVATSVLRARNVHAFSLRDGFEGLSDNSYP